MTEALQEEVRAGETRALLRRGGVWQSAPQETSEPLNPTQQEALEEVLTPACYVCDVNGAEVVTDSFADMLALYKHLTSQSLQKDRCQVVRVKNSFSTEVSKAEAATKGGYRDLKLWLMVIISKTRFVAELQVHLRCFYELKRVMHLPYECSRGSFDHPHLAGIWHDAPASGKKCCAGCVAM